MTRAAVALGLLPVVLMGCAHHGERENLAANAAPPRHYAGECQLVGLANGRTVQLATTDVLGRPVQLGTPGQARPTVVFFVSRTSKDEASELMQTVDDQIMTRPIDTVAFVDVTRYAGILHKAASWQLRKSAEEARVKRRQRREERGVDASAEAVDRWHLVGDFSGTELARFGVAREPAHPIAFVVGCSGAVLGPFHDADSLLAAVTLASGVRSARSTPPSNRR